MGATSAKDDDLIASTLDGRMKKNTIEQMRSRVRKGVAKAIEGSPRVMVLAMTLAGVLAMGAFSSTAPAGEQTGGRKGSDRIADVSLIATGMIAPEGEQTGGRKGGG